MYVVEDITDNMNEQEQDVWGGWYSVIHDMKSYRVRSGCSGYTLFDNENNQLDDEELQQNVYKAIDKYLRSKV